MPRPWSSTRCQPKDQREERKRIAECEQSQRHVNKSDEQPAEPSGNPNPPASQSENRGERRRDRQHKRWRRREAWIRHHRAAIEAISAAIIATFTLALFFTSL